MISFKLFYVKIDAIDENFDFIESLLYFELHNAVVDSTIGGHAIKKGTQVNMNQHAILNDPRHWGKPEEFRPERFLDKKGKHNSRVPAFVWIGRRACLGEKLAVADLVFITCRLLQATRGYTIALPGGPGSVCLDGDPKYAGGLVSDKYKIVLQPIQ